MISKVGRPFLWIEDEDLLVQVFTNEIKRGSEVGVAANQRERTHVSCIGIAEHFRRKVDIRTLFLELHHMNELAVIDGIARKTSVIQSGQPGLVFVVFSEEDLHTSFCGKA